MFFFLAFHCPPGWDEFDNSCYKRMQKFVYSLALSWENARAVCLGFGGDLVKIENEKEMEFIKFLSSAFKTRVWIGLNDRHEEGQFVWSDGTPFNSSVYNSWADGEPNNAIEKEDCVEVYGDNGWNDNRCDVNLQYICERPKGGLIFV